MSPDSTMCETCDGTGKVNCGLCHGEGVFSCTDGCHTMECDGWDPDCVDGQVMCETCGPLDDPDPGVGTSR